MSRVFITGDTHYKEEYQKVERLCEIAETDKDDFLIVLGDHGCNYYGETKDRRMKKYLSLFPFRLSLSKAITIRGQAKSYATMSRSLTHVSLGSS